MRVIRNYYREKYNLFGVNITNQDFINIVNDLETKRTIIIEKIKRKIILEVFQKRIKKS